MPPVLPDGAIACPARSTSDAGATEASQCKCVAGFFDADTAVQGVSCQACQKCAANQHMTASCGPVHVGATYGQDAQCSACPLNSKLPSEKPHVAGSTSLRRRSFGVVAHTLVQPCVCDDGFYNEAPALSEVSCAAIPPEFGAGADKTAKCQWFKFGTGQKEHIKLDLSNSNTQQLQLAGTMVQYFKDVSTDQLYAADFNLACGTLLQEYNGAAGSICSKSLALFGKTGNNATHVNFLGNARLECHGFNDLYMLGKVCFEPCINDESQGC